MELNRKRSKVIKLQTDNRENCIVEFPYHLERPDNYMTKSYLNSINGTAKHLYFTTDDEIKEGDWMIREDEQPVLVTSNFYWDFKEPYKKIVATTDKSLIIEEINQCDGCNADLPLENGVHKDKQLFGIACTKDRYVKKLPQPSEAFIQKYCELGGIDEVDIEMEDMGAETYGEIQGYTIKVDSHNTITIHPIKDSWNREEVEKKLMDLANVLYPNKSSDEINMKLFMANWIKDNLK